MVHLLMNYESVLYVCVSNVPVFVASASISLHVTYDNPRIVFYIVWLIQAQRSLEKLHYFSDVKLRNNFKNIIHQ